MSGVARRVVLGLPRHVSAHHHRGSIASAASAVAALSLALVPSAWATINRASDMGENNLGQLGIGTETGPENCPGSGACSTVPVAVSGLTEATAVSAGVGHSLTLRSNEEVVSWGLNEYGQLGNGSTTRSITPVAVCVEVACANHLGHVQAIAASFFQSMALQNGEVLTWGEDQYGELGVATAPQQCGSTPCSTVPVRVSGLQHVSAIADGGGHDLALQEGTVWAWGRNERGQLGIGSTTNQSQPVRVCESKTCNPTTGPWLEHVKAIAAGAYSSYAVLENGTVVSWGENFGGSLGNGSATGPEECQVNPIKFCSKTPVHVVNLEHVKTVASHSGAWFALALLENGTVYSWGENQWGQLGDGQDGIEEVTKAVNHSATPVQVVGLSEVAAIAAGGSHSLALKTSGNMLAWGRNNWGQLGQGLGGTKVEYLDEPIEMLTDVSSIGGGNVTSLAVQTGSAPEFKINNVLATGAGSPTFDAGEVTLESTNGVVGKIRCRLLANGNVWNETERGHARVESLLASPCKSEASPECKGISLASERPVNPKTAARGESTPPFAAQLLRTTEGEITVRRLMLVRLRLLLIDPCVPITLPFEGTVAPRVMNGLSNGLHPTKLAFSTQAGYLVNPELLEHGQEERLYLTLSPLNLPGESALLEPKLSGEAMQLITATE
jgi:alpha-tubulin suppressor-like RCC1 family protein